MNLYDAKTALKAALERRARADIAKCTADRMCLLTRTSIVLDNDPKELGSNEETRLARIREMMSVELQHQHDADIEFKQADLEASLARVDFEVALRETQ